MLGVFRFVAMAVEWLLALPFRLAHAFLQTFVFNPSLGPLRHVVTLGVIYVLFAATLVYVIAPIRGYTGQIYHGEKLQYDAERWLATAIYDRGNTFIGTFDPRLDSRRDVNYTGAPIEVADGAYVANPDHKSIPVRSAPEYYWRCLAYHEDRHIGTWLNPFGIDFIGVLKIPLTTVTRSIEARSLRLGVGGSTIPMQLARVIYKTPPERGEGPFVKLRRKLTEWWMAPVIYAELTKGGDMEPLKQWAANHLWLGQRGAGDLHGVEMTARILFGKTARKLSVAQQFVLAAAVNKPIIILDGSDRLNRVRMDRWRYIVEVRARKCAGELISEPNTRKEVFFELAEIANGPPDPEVAPELEQLLVDVVPKSARGARANPALRANAMIPAVRYGVREEMKNEFGYDWRRYVRGLSLTLGAVDNRRFRERVHDQLAELETKYRGKIGLNYALDVKRARTDEGVARDLPDVIVAAADEQGRIVRYFEARDTAAYFGSPGARDSESGRYDPARETRAIASIGKMISAIGVANQGRDTLATTYVDDQAPARGLESCRRKGNLRQGRTAEVSFACSLSRPLEWRTARLGQLKVAGLIKRLGFNLPPAPTPELATPPSTAAVRGFITGSPQRVHQMSSVILAALTGRGAERQRLPTLVAKWDRPGLLPLDASEASAFDIIPHDVIEKGSEARLAQLLSAPLCYEHRSKRHGTLKSIADWCARRRSDVQLHFAKTGTAVNEDPDATVDVWVSGGIRFETGKAYSYVVVVGTGSTAQPWARSLHSSQIAAPLLRVLLEDLEADAKSSPALVDAGSSQG